MNLLKILHHQKSHNVISCKCQHSSISENMRIILFKPFAIDTSLHFTIQGCYVGTDLAHAIGNIELHLTDWEIDFACWCNYKYVCASPAGIAGFYLHEKHAYNFDLPR